MVVALLVALPLGIVAAVLPGTLVDHAAMTLALVGISMPNFWLGPLLAILFSVKLGWLPVSGTARWRISCCRRSRSARRWPRSSPA